MHPPMLGYKLGHAWESQKVEQRNGLITSARPGYGRGYVAKLPPSRSVDPYTQLWESNLKLSTATNATHSANSSHFSSSLTTKNSNPIAGNGGCLKHGGGGRLQPVLMRPTPQLSFKTLVGGRSSWGGGGFLRGGGGGGLAGGPGGGVWQGVGGGSSRGSWGHPARGEGGGVRVRARVRVRVSPRVRVSVRVRARARVGARVVVAVRACSPPVALLLVVLTQI